VQRRDCMSRMRRRKYDEAQLNAIETYEPAKSVLGNTGWWSALRRGRDMRAGNGGAGRAHITSNELTVIMRRRIDKCIIFVNGRRWRASTAPYRGPRRRSP
jgi:hypothetical protein